MSSFEKTLDRMIEVARELGQARRPSNPPAVVYQCPRCATAMEVDPTAKPEARGVVDVEAIRRACQSGKRFWQAGPGYYEEIESLLPALTETRNG